MERMADAVEQRWAAHVPPLDSAARSALSCSSGFRTLWGYRPAS